MDDSMTWVEIEWEVLSRETRLLSGTGGVARAPYMARTRGFLESDEPSPDGRVKIRTVNERALSGRLIEKFPGYAHSFGHPLPAWIKMAAAIRKTSQAMDDGADGPRQVNEERLS